MIDIIEPSPYGAIPDERHLVWHKREYYGFVHLSLNTYTNREWGFGDESPELFNPKEFDADAIVAFFVEAGLKGLILTCKHHDGFCLWPSKYTEHSVKNSPWREGQGDVVREVSDACKSHGIGFGVYLSPWDRNHAEYGTPAYIEYYRNQLEELTSEYGDVVEVWFDGANGGKGYYGGARDVRSIDRKNYYDWDNTWEIVRKNQPLAVMFSDGGPDIRWVGNERGVAGDPCWHSLSVEELYPGFGADDRKTKVEKDKVKAWGSDGQMLKTGDLDSDSWVPAECDVSIRPGWFYHGHENLFVRSPKNLMKIYMNSIGLGANFLLNFPPDRLGRIHKRDQKNALKFAHLREKMFETNLFLSADVTASQTRGDRTEYAIKNVRSSDDEYWATDDGVQSAEVIISWKEKQRVSLIDMREVIRLGQRISDFKIEIKDNHVGEWTLAGKGESIGNRRLLPLKPANILRVRISFKTKSPCVILKEIGVY